MRRAPDPEHPSAHPMRPMGGVAPSPTGRRTSEYARGAHTARRSASSVAVSNGASRPRRPRRRRGSACACGSAVGGASPPRRRRLRRSGGALPARSRSRGAAGGARPARSRRRSRRAATGPFAEDPFAVARGQARAAARRREAMRGDPRIVRRTACAAPHHRRPSPRPRAQRCEQTRRVRRRRSRYAVDGDERQARSYPAGHGGSSRRPAGSTCGPRPAGDAPRVAAEAVELLSAPLCPSGRMTSSSAASSSRCRSTSRSATRSSSTGCSSASRPTRAELGAPRGLRHACATAPST